MSNTDRLTTIRNTVQAVLNKNGWKTDDFPAAGVKLYDTAVGPKQAESWLPRRIPNKEPLVCLSGRYESEGNNILGNCSVLIPVDATADEIEAYTQQYCDTVNAKIADSYAVRLLN